MASGESNTDIQFTGDDLPPAELEAYPSSRLFLAASSENFLQEWSLEAGAPPTHTYNSHFCSCESSNNSLLLFIFYSSILYSLPGRNMCY